MIQEITCSGFMELILEPLLSATATAFNTTRACGIICSQCSGFGLTHSKEQKRISNATTTAGQGVGRGAEEVSAKNFKMLLTARITFAFSSPHNISIVGPELL